MFPINISLLSGHLLEVEIAHQWQQQQQFSMPDAETKRWLEVELQLLYDKVACCDTLLVKNQAMFEEAM